MSRPEDVMITMRNSEPDGLGPVLSDLRDNVGTRALGMLPALSVFEYTDGAFGYTRSGGPNWTAEKNTGVTARSTGVDYFFAAVLAHEMGHYFGLDHPGHDGLQYIMYSPSKNKWDADFVATLVSYLFVGGEPEFSMTDAENAWDWIINIAPDGLPA